MPFMKLLTWIIAFFCVVHTSIHAIEETKKASPSQTPECKDSKEIQTTCTPKDQESSLAQEKVTQDKKEKEDQSKKESQDKEKKEKEKKEQEKKKKEKESETPWFIGTFLSQYGENVEPGRVIVSPSLLYWRLYGTYDAHGDLIRDRNNHLKSLFMFVEGGITKKVDVTVDTGGTWINAGGRRDVFHLIDTQILLGFQLLTDKKGTCIPDVRVMIGESFPTGKFDHLDPIIRLADVTGIGSYATIFLLIWQKIIYTCPKHPYKWNLNLQMNCPSKVRTEGLSLYGGAPGVLGMAVPGYRFIANLSYEYKFDKHWGWGIDVHYEHQNRSKFDAKFGTPIFAGLPSSETFSLAPEVEYDVNEDFSISAGCWYTLWGRNNIAFINGFFELSYQF